MLVVDMILKKGMKGEIDLMSPAKKVMNELLSIPDFSDAPDSIFDQLSILLEGFKKAILLTAGAAVQKLSQTLSKEQEVLMNVSDMIIWTYQAESALLRLGKMNSKGLDVSIAEQIVQTYFYDSADHIAKAAKDALNSFMSGDELAMSLMGIRRFTKMKSFNAKEARQQIAQFVIEKGKYAIL
jgi:hypothetical protein